jgi:transposase-like protein
MQCPQCQRGRSRKVKEDRENYLSFYFCPNCGGQFTVDFNRNMYVDYCWPDWVHETVPASRAAAVSRVSKEGTADDVS